MSQNKQIQQHLLKHELYVQHFVVLQIASIENTDPIPYVKKSESNFMRQRWLIVLYLALFLSRILKSVQLPNASQFFVQPFFTYHAIGRYDQQSHQRDAM